MGEPLIPSCTPVLSIGSPLKRTRLRFRLGAMFCMTPITSALNLEMALPSNTDLPSPFMPTLTSLKGRMSSASSRVSPATPRKAHASKARTPLASKGQRLDPAPSVAKVGVKWVPLMNWRSTPIPHDNTELRWGLHERGDRDPHEIEQSCHAPLEQMGQKDAPTLPIGIRLLKDRVAMVEGVELLRQDKRILCQGRELEAHNDLLHSEPVATQH